MTATTAAPTPTPSKVRARKTKQLNRRDATHELLELRERFDFYLAVGDMANAKLVFDQARRVAFDALDELIRVEQEVFAPLPVTGSIHQYSED